MSLPAGDSGPAADELVEATGVVEQQLAVLFRRARAGFEQLAREVHPGLDAGAYGILHLIDTGAATTVTALADRLAVGKPTISRQISALEQLGLLSRERVRPNSRAVELRLTGEGRVRLGAARTRRREQFRTMLQEWRAEDVTALGVLLTRFNDLPW